MFNKQFAKEIVFIVTLLLFNLSLYTGIIGDICVLGLFVQRLTSASDQCCMIIKHKFKLSALH